MKFSLFSSAVVVGRPRSSLAPIAHFTSIRNSSSAAFASASALSKLSKKIYETIACHSAVRSGENLDERQVKSLFKQASEVGFCWTCPHGRNCFKFFDKTQVEKWFDRI